MSNDQNVAKAATDQTDQTDQVIAQMSLSEAVKVVRAAGYVVMTSAQAGVKVASASDRSEKVPHAEVYAYLDGLTINGRKMSRAEVANACDVTTSLISTVSSLTNPENEKNVWSRVTFEAKKVLIEAERANIETLEVLIA